MLKIFSPNNDKFELESGFAQLENIGFDLNCLIERMVSLNQPNALDRGLVLEIAFIDPLLSPVLINDPFRLGLLIFNLINQGLTHSSSGGMEIRCEVKEDAEKVQTVLLKLIDKAPDNLSESLTKAHQGASSNRFKDSFFNLYHLNFSDKVISLLNGQLIYTIDRDLQEVICLEIEFLKGTQLDALADKEIDFQFIQSKRILLAEENDLNRMQLKGLFQEKGAEVIVCENGLEVLEKLEEFTVDWVILSAGLTLLNGMETARIIREKGNSGISIIGLLPDEAKVGEDILMKSGMNGYLVKPFDEIELFEKLKEWQGEENKSSPKELLYDLDKLKVICSGNLSLMQYMVDLFIEISGQSIIEMQVALNNNQLEEVSRLAHRLKPSLNSMGIKCIKKDIVLLEDAGLSQDEMSQIYSKIKEVIIQVNKELRKVNLV